MKKISKLLIPAMIGLLFSISGKAQAATVITPTVVSDIKSSSETVEATTMQVTSLNGREVYQFTLDSPSMVQVDAAYTLSDKYSCKISDMLSSDENATNIIEQQSSTYAKFGTRQYQEYLEAGTYYYTFVWDEYSSDNTLASNACFSISVKAQSVDRGTGLCSSVSEAGTLSLGTQQRCFFSNTVKEQVYKFVLTKDATISYNCYNDYGFAKKNGYDGYYDYVYVIDANGQTFKETKKWEPSSGESLTDSVSLSAGTYYLRYKAYRCGWGSITVSSSAESSATATAAPKTTAAPTKTTTTTTKKDTTSNSDDEKVTVSYGKCKVTWGKQKKAKYYRIYQKGSNGWVLLTTTTKSKYTFSSGASGKFIKGKSYKFRIKSVNKKGRTIRTLTKSVKAV
jgi:hypothetical protein